MHVYASKSKEIVDPEMLNVTFLLVCFLGFKKLIKEFAGIVSKSKLSCIA